MVHNLSLQLPFFIVILTTHEFLKLLLYFICSLKKIGLLPKKDWFTTFKSANCGLVLMENDVVDKIVGISTIRIRMQNRIVKNLTNVQHLPDLKNMVFL
jgi:hypothetical protein